MSSLHQFVQNRESTAARPSAELIDRFGVTLPDALDTIQFFFDTLLNDLQDIYVNGSSISFFKPSFFETLSEHASSQIVRWVKKKQKNGIYTSDGGRLIRNEYSSNEVCCGTQNIQSNIFFQQLCSIQINDGSSKQVRVDLLFFVMQSQQSKEVYTVGILVYGIQYVGGTTPNSNVAFGIQRPIQAPPADGRPFLEYYQQKLNKYRENLLFSEAALLTDAVMQELMYLTLPEKNEHGELVSSLVWPISGFVSLRRSLQKINEVLHGA